jgi:hypothetical protein
MKVIDKHEKDLAANLKKMAELYKEDPEVAKQREI